MVELRVNGMDVDLVADTNINLTQQVADIADISTVNASFTNSFKIPKTPENTLIFDSLGQSSDGSQVPYKKTQATLLSNGIALVKYGWLEVRETAESFYNVNIKDGIIDFFRAIQPLKFGVDIQIPEIEHTKDIPTVIASKTNENYRYIVNDYGGMPPFLFSNNIDFLVPSIRLSLLWDKVFEAVGYTYTGVVFADNDFTEAWVTYPKENGAAVESNLVKFSHGASIYNEMQFVALNGAWRLRGLSNVLPPPWVQTPVPIPDFVQSQNGRNFYNLVAIQLLGASYRFTVRCDMQARYRFKTPFNYWYAYLPCILKVYKNGQQILSQKTDGSEQELVIALNYADVIWCEITQDPNYNEVNGYPLNGMKIHEFTELVLDVKKIGVAELDVAAALKSLTPEQLLREVMWRFALTPIINKDEKRIDFFTIDEMMDSADDWSDFYDSRRNEKYAIGNYAQINRFAHRYFTEMTGYNDGIIIIGNENLEVERNILESKFYAPAEIYTDSYFTTTAQSVRQTAIWSREVVEQSDGSLETKTKPENDRFFWLKNEMINDDINYFSLNLGTSGSTDSYPLARFDGTTMDYFVEKYHKGHKLLLNDARVNEFNLIMSAADVSGVDFTRLKYFKQEQQYYKLNRLIYDGKKAVGEFIRVKLWRKI
jgi:hypothetical protein